MELREEADSLLHDFGLLASLKRYGEVHPVGSYRMNMMVWRDLDVDLACDSISPEMMYSISAEINNRLNPYRFEGRYGVGENRSFYGCETAVTGTCWNLDLWFLPKDDILKAEEYCDAVGSCMQRNPVLGRAVREIKLGLIQKKMYGIGKNPNRHYHSHDIYEAVLHGGVRSCQEFLEKFPK